MHLSEALEFLDNQMNLVSTLLMQNQADALEPAIRQLRDGMEAFAGLAQRFDAAEFTPANQQRMQEMSDRLGLMREHIVKALAITGQQLAVMLPEQVNFSTYGASAKLPGSAASVARMYHISG
jgi:exonuclease VII small subunit